jgi:gliding motility-associated-like protein
VIVDLKANTTDNDGNLLTISITKNAKHGNAVISSDGKLTYTSNSGFFGSDTIIYSVCDNGTPQLCTIGCIIITVSPSNFVPIIAEITKTIVQNKVLTFTQVDFTTKFTDADNDTLFKIQIVTLPAHGLLKLAGNAVVVGQEINYTILNKLEFVPNYDYVGETNFTWKASDGKEYSLPNDVRITVAPQETFIPAGFSPNGDGINDFFFIQGADKFVVDLQIFNRWGNKVYESKHYQNNWDGVSNSGLLIGSKLPGGTYFYVVNFNNGTKEEIGFITINR